MRIQRRSGWTIGRAGMLLALLALVLAAPAATATAAKPIAGGIYSWFGGKGRGTGSSVDVQVSALGRSATVEWTVIKTASSSSGCTTRFPNGTSLSYPNQNITGVKATIRSDGSFHGIVRTTFPGSLGKTRNVLAEARGQFIANGQSVNVSTRLKFVAQMPTYTITCDGRWVNFKAPLAGTDTRGLGMRAPGPPVLATFAPKTQFPEGLAIDRSGSLYVSVTTWGKTEKDPNTERVWRITPAGKKTAFANGADSIPSARR